MFVSREIDAQQNISLVAKNRCGPQTTAERKNVSKLRSAVRVRVGANGLGTKAMNNDNNRSSPLSYTEQHCKCPKRNACDGGQVFVG